MTKQALIRLTTKEAAEAAVRHNRKVIIEKWATARPAQRFIRDQFPGVWDAISRCRMDWTIQERTNQPGRYRLVPMQTCREHPFCILCNEAETWKRVRQVTERFRKCTPQGAKGRYLHIVQTAPIYQDDTQAGQWGTKAQTDPAGFRELVWEALKDTFGEGIGGFLTFQAFGEKAFTKWHPHIDLTLNGWTLDGNTPKELERPQLQGGGRARWDERIRRGATRYDIAPNDGNVNFGNIVVGEANYRSILRYQLRELVDVSKIITYDPARQTLEWASYADNTRTPMTVRQFRDGLIQYQARYGFWAERRNPQRTTLEAAYGHMSNRRIDTTAQIMGRTEEGHPMDCTCAWCGEWEETDLPAVEALVGTGRVTLD